MKLRSITLENVRSFLDKEELSLDGDISIIIGPNGGGKTNLLDAIVGFVRKHVVVSWLRKPNPVEGNPRREDFQSNPMMRNLNFDRHSQALDRDQIVTLKLEVTAHDIKNIEIIYKNWSAIDQHRKHQNIYFGEGMFDASQWYSNRLRPGDLVTVRIVNNEIQPVVERDAVFLSYLKWYEMASSLCVDLGLPPLSPPVLSLPVRRSSSGFSTFVALPNFSEADQRQGVDAASSRVDANLASLATGKLAHRYRTLLSQQPATAKQTFYGEENVAKLTAALRNLGYAWELIEVSSIGNTYDISLTKQGTSFMAASASSGEKELLTYLFAIYALDIREALIVIDEPELHLHPRWQVNLMNLFRELAEETGNQFVMATHSPSFVSPSSIEYVSRVYSEAQRSRIVRLNSVQLPGAKHLFSIVNSLNSERIFFADVVVLVEGISDRIFFERLIQHFDKGGAKRILEVVSVGGKGLFKPYRDLLGACHIQGLLVADRDYANNIGSEEVKKLFAADGVSIKTDVLENPKSRDGASLLEEMDTAISGGDMKALQDLWEYIKSRRASVSTLASPEQDAILNEFIMKKYEDGIFILKAGALEAYLPEGHSSKDVDKLISFTTSEKYWADVPDSVKEELEGIAGGLLGAL